jgi:antitoxin MazE
MHAHIQKWGNSLGLRIPKHFVQLLHLQPGSPVIIEIENGKIIIQPPRYHLDAMLKEITTKNRHHQLLEDSKIGSEEW